MLISLPLLQDLPINQVGYLAMFIVLLLDGATIPFTPVELFLCFAGYLVAIGEMSFLGALVVTVAGNVAGHIISYTLGYMVGRPFFTRYGKYFLITPDRLAVAEDRAKQIGPAAAFFFRMIPGLRAFGSILLGTVRMRFGEFVLLTTCGVTLWNIIFITLGLYFGVAFASEASWLVPLVISIIAAGLCLTVIAWYGIILRKRSKNKRLLSI